jgi:hypothetical protein
MSDYNLSALAAENARLILRLGELDAELYPEFSADYTDLKLQKPKHSPEYANINNRLWNMLLKCEALLLEQELAAKKKT